MRLRKCDHFVVASDKVPDVVKILPEVGVLLLNVFLVKPFIESLTDIALPKVEHRLCILAAGLLHAPGSRVSEVKVTWEWLWASIVMFLEVESVVNIVVRSDFGLNCLHPGVVPADVSCAHQVIKGIFVDCLCIWGVIATCDDIHNDVRRFKSHVDALIDSGIDIDVPS